MTEKIINISKEEIRDKMFFIREEDSDQPIAVVKVADLLEKEVKKEERPQFSISYLHQDSITKSDTQM